MDFRVELLAEAVERKYREFTGTAPYKRFVGAGSPGTDILLFQKDYFLAHTA